MLATEAPFPQYFDADGSPLDAGYLYWGVAGQNPETNPITVYWDQAGTQPAAQPIRTINGYAARSGTAAAIYAPGDYSITVRDSVGRLLPGASSSASAANSLSILAQLTAFIASLASTIGATLVGFLQIGVGAILRTVYAKLLDLPLDVKEFGADPTGAASSALAFQKCIDAAALLQIGTITGRGKFLLDAAVNFKPGVHFVGDMPTNYFASSHGAGADIIGTTLLMTYGAGTPAAQPALTFQYNSGIRRCALYWPNQVDSVTGLVANIVSYPWAIQVGQAGVTSAGNSDSVRIEDVTLLNPYKGITDGDGANLAGQTVLRNVNVLGALTTGIQLTKTLNTVFDNINITATWWQQNATMMAYLLSNATTTGLSTAVKDYAAFVNVYINFLCNGWIDTSPTSTGWVEATNFVIDECANPLVCSGSTRFTYNGGTVSRGTSVNPLARVTGTVGSINFTGTKFIGSNAGHSNGIFADHQTGILNVTGCIFENADKPAVLSISTGQTNVSNCGGTNGVIDWHSAIVNNGSVNGHFSLIKGADVSADFPHLSFDAFVAGLPTGWTGLPSNAYCTQITNGIKIGGSTGNFGLNLSTALFPKYGHMILEMTLTLQMASAGSRFDMGYAYNSSTGNTPYKSVIGGDAGYAVSLPQGVPMLVRVPLIGGASSDTLRFFFSLANAADFVSMTSVKIYAATPPLGMTGCEYSIGIGTDPPVTQYLGGIKQSFQAGKPTVGAYNVNDIVWRFPAVIGQPAGWICTTAPLTFGQIAALT
jgi:hypothetical protein